MEGPKVRKIEIGRISCDGLPCADPKVDIRRARYGGIKVVPLPQFDRKPVQAYRP